MDHTFDSSRVCTMCGFSQVQGLILGDYQPDCSCDVQHERDYASYLDQLNAEFEEFRP